MRAGVVYLGVEVVGKRGGKVDQGAERGRTSVALEVSPSERWLRRLESGHVEVL